jgi:hypothetical protein
VSRSGYTDDCDDYSALYLYRATVERSLKGKRGQSFLIELAKTLDEMPEKRLIQSELISATGEVCTIGAVCKARGIDVDGVEVEDPDEVGDLVNISRSMAAEIEYENDEAGSSDETPEQRWVRMRKWVARTITKEDK